jgi:SAM-dependent methyltransferase
MNQSKIWDYYQGEGVNNFDDATPRLQYLFKKANKLANTDTPKILNIGYGSGWVENECVKNNWNVYSLDPSHDPENVNNKKINFVSGGIEKTAFLDNEFDIIFCSEVLEHLVNEDLANGVREIKRILKEDGLLIGTVPFKENLQENNVVCPKCGIKFHRWGHHQEFDKNKLQDIFKMEGLSIIELKTKAFQDYSKFTLTNNLKYFIRKILASLSSTLIYSNIFFIVKK